jgi:hypothetical protein
VNTEFTAVLTEQGSKKVADTLKFPPAFVQSYEGLGLFPSWVAKVTSGLNPHHSCACMINYHQNQPEQIFFSTTSTTCLPHIFEAFKLCDKDVKWTKPPNPEDLCT